MKKTIIFLFTLAGGAMGETIAGYTDTYTDWNNGTITLNQALDLSLDYWSIETTITLIASTPTETWGTRVFYSSSDENPGVNNFFLWHGNTDTGNPQIERNIIKFRGFGFQKGSEDYRVRSITTSEELLYKADTYIFNYTKDGEMLTLSVYDSERILLGSTVIDTPDTMNGTISTLKSDIDTALGYTMPVVTISTINPSVPEPSTATLSLLALAGLAARRRRK